MAGREKDWDDAHGSKEAGSCDPETLYTKEFCIGSSHASFPFLAGGAPVAGTEGSKRRKQKRGGDVICFPPLRCEELIGLILGVF